MLKKKFILPFTKITINTLSLKWALITHLNLNNLNRHNKLKMNNIENKKRRLFLLTVVTSTIPTLHKYSPLVNCLMKPLQEYKHIHHWKRRKDVCYIGEDNTSGENYNARKIDVKKTKQYTDSVELI